MDSRQKALEYATRALGYQKLTSQSLFDKIVRKGYSQEDAAFCVSKMTQLGAIDDTEYAASFAAELSVRGYGAGRLKQKLRQKGVDREQIDDTLATFTPNYDKMKKYIASKLRGKEADRALIKKITDGLFRRGFSWEEINRAMREYNLELEDEYDI